ncbi:MAG: hypothetical protein LBM66_06180 [Bifidobacteriaceae bacterium]|jgi:hypothetical protein|nr:hypothetical protein [Bifidobacteriaceae bacterium]
MITTNHNIRLITQGEDQSGGGKDDAGTDPVFQAPPEPAKTANPPQPGQAGQANRSADPDGQDALGDAGKRALDQERATVKALKDQLAELTAYKKAAEDAKLTAEEKTAKDLKEAQEMAQAASAKALRYEAAAQVQGFPLAMAARLQGDSLDDLKADAQQLLDAIGQAAGSKEPARPAPDPGAGHGGAPQASGLDGAVAAFYTA